MSKELQIAKNPNYLTKDKVIQMGLAKKYNIVMTQDLIEAAQKQLVQYFDDYKEDNENRASYKAIPFGGNVNELKKTFEVESEVNDGYFYDELSEKSSKELKLFKYYYPELFDSTFDYGYEWNDGEYGLFVYLDGENLKDNEIVKKENPNYLASKLINIKLERIEKLMDKGFTLYAERSYQKTVKKEDIIKYVLNPNSFLTCDLFRYTDYDGGYTIAKANIKYIEENFEELINTESIDIYKTAYSGENCEFNLDSLANDELYEILLGIHDYPVVDDDTLSEVEMELENECWDSYGRDDFKKALNEQYGDAAEELSDEDIDNLAHEASQWTSEGKGHVEAMQFYFGIDSLVEAIEKIDEKSKEKLVKKENPVAVLKTPDWVSDSDTWIKATKQSLKDFGKISYPFVVFLYKQLGGKVKKKK